MSESWAGFDRCCCLSGFGGSGGSAAKAFGDGGGQGAALAVAAVTPLVAAVEGLELEVNALLESAHFHRNRAKGTLSNAIRGAFEGQANPSASPPKTAG